VALPAIDPDLLPKLGAPKPDRGWFRSGLSAGIDNLQGLGGSAIELTGRLTGLDGVERTGAEIADRNLQEASANGRPDLEIAPWKEDGAPILPWLGYQTAKQLPQLGLVMAGARATPKALVSGGLRDFGATAPKILGGGGLKAGADVATRRAALQTGDIFARRVAAAGALGTPLGAGAMYQEAKQAAPDGDVSTGTALAAAALSPVYAALDVLELPILSGIAKAGTGKLLKRVATGMMVGAAAEIPQEGMQTALEQAFRPDLSVRDRMANIVEGALTGGAVGGVLGGMAGIRKAKMADPSTMSNDTLNRVTGEVLGLPDMTKMTVDSAGRAVQSSTGVEDLLATPNEPRESDALVAGYYPQAPLQIESQTIIQGKQGSLRHAKPFESEEQRPFGSAPTAELESMARVAGNYLSAREGEEFTDKDRKVLEQYQMVVDELSTRQSVNGSSTETMAASRAAGAVEPGSDVTGGSAATNSAAPASANTITDLLKGVSTRKAYAGATTPDEARDILIQRLEAGSTAKGDMVMAERLGVDVNEPAGAVAATEATGIPDQTQQTPLATDPIATTAPAAPANEGGGDQPADVEFQTQWNDKLRKHRGGAIQALRQNPPANEEQAKRAIYDALGANVDAKVDGYKGVTKLAEDFGLMTTDGQLTDEGVRIARSALPIEETVKEAISRDYSGVEASAFDRGARGDRNVKLGSIAELRAFNDGKEWALDRRARTAPIPETTSDDQAQDVIENVRTATVSEGVPEERVRMQFLNQAIDQVYGSTLKGGQQAQLKRMVKQGATDAEIDEAAARMAAGETVLATPAPERREYRGEVVTRGLINAKTLAARLQAEAQDLAIVKAALAGRKGQSQRVIAEHRRYKAQLREAINDAAVNGEITPRDRIALIHKLARNDFKGIEERLSNSQARVSRRDFLAGVAAVAVTGVPTRARAQDNITPASDELRKLAIAGDIIGSLNWIKGYSKNSGYRMLAVKLLRGGWASVRMNYLPVDSDTVRATTDLDDDGTSLITVYGRDGMNEETLLHEFVHAYVQQRWANISVYVPHNKKMLKDTIDRSDKLIERFQDVWQQVARALEKTNPDLTETEVFAQAIWSDPDELLSWALTNPQAQAYLKSVDINGDKISTELSLWDSFVKFITELFGGTFNKTITTALDHVMGAGFAILDAGVAIKSNDFAQKMAKGIAEQRNMAAEGPPIASVSNAQAKTAVDRIVKASERLRDTDGMLGKVRQFTLGWTSLHGANEFWGKWFDRIGTSGETVANGAFAYEQALNEKNAIVARMAQMLTDVRDAYEQLESRHKDSAQTIVKLMKMSEFGINPMKPWREQAAKIRDSRNAKNLEKKTNEAHNLYRKLNARGHADVYKDLRDVNDVLMLSTLGVSLHQHVDADGYARGRMAAFAANPMDAFMAEQATKDFTPADARKWWADRIQSQINEVYNFLDGQRSLRDATDITNEAKEALSTHIDDLGKRVHGIQETVRALEDAPYFHLGRYGDFFVGWRVKDSEALAKVADRLADLGFEGVITDGTDKLKVYMRVENRTLQANLDTAVRQLAREGLVDPGKIRTGQRTREDYTGGFQPQWANQMIASLEESDLPDDIRDQAINSLRGYSVDLMPEMSLARVMTHREGVPGYSPDMMRSFDWRAQVGINALAGMVTAPKITQSFVDMRGALDEAETTGIADAPLEQRRGMRDIIDEYSRREKERAVWPETRALDQIKGVATAWFLGFSVSYGFVNLTQLGATLWPELGAKHGFVEAAKAISKATPIAFKIMKEVAKHGYDVSLARAQDAVITQDVLRKVVGSEMAEYLMRVVNTGNLDIGGPSRELIRSAEGRGDGKLDLALRYASSIGYYTETTSRLIAALATKQLNPQMGVADAADRAAYVLNETMWNYARTNQGREFGKMGVLGKYTPLVTQFLQFQAQLSEKLFREAYDAIKGETPAARKEARRYLKGHLAAMTVLAGSLGLPMATVFATVINQLKDIWDEDEEPSNIRAAYRNWLADTLGIDAGEIVAHGVFRGVGFDISSRIGEQDIIPFSKFIADRRKMKDRVEELALRTWGAPTSLLTNWFEGGEKIMDGDILGGVTRMLPNAFAAPAKAYKLTQDGYTDTSGKKLPMEAGAQDVLIQLLGFNPAPKAEYSEARQDQTMRKGQLTRRASTLRNQIADAVVGGDSETARSLIIEAQEFDQQNPAFALLPRLDDTIRRRAKVSAAAQITHTPLGVSLKDLEGQQLTRYADY
jgi:hypothetical protein